MLLKIAERIFDSINNVLIILLSILIVLDWLLVSFEISSRYFFGAPSQWVTEFSEYSFLYIAFLGMAWLQKRDQHIKIDFHKALKPNRVAAVEFITSIIGMIMSLVLSRGPLLKSPSQICLSKTPNQGTLNGMK